MHPNSQQLAKYISLQCLLLTSKKIKMSKSQSSRIFLFIRDNSWIERVNIQAIRVPIMQAEASTEFLTGTISGESGKVADSSQEVLVSVIPVGERS